MAHDVLGDKDFAPFGHHHANSPTRFQSARDRCRTATGGNWNVPEVPTVRPRRRQRRELEHLGDHPQRPFRGAGGTHVSEYVSRPTLGRERR